MFQFDAATERELARLAPFFQFKVRCWFVLVKLFLGIDLWIVSGVRTAAQQQQLHNQDKRNPAPVAGHPDVHQLGIAVDVDGKRNGVNVLLKTSPAEDWQAVADLAELCLIRRWGHHFINYDDRNHWDDLAV